MIQIKKVVVGDLEENCYIITNKNKTIIIDPGDDSQKIINKCKNHNVVGVLITHHHFDHVGALNEILNHYSISEEKFIEGFDYKILETPGHSKDSVTYYFYKDNIMFCGDFLFKDAIGRTDLPTGSDVEMKKSLEEISKYPDDTLLFPGHGLSTILGVEKDNFDYYYKNLNL